jgi:xanthosine utilization system XapX-like protein
MSAVDEQLERERRLAPLAVAGTALAAILPMAGAIVGAGVLADQPKDSASKLLYFNAHDGTLIMSSILLSLGALAIMVPLTYLYSATKFRRPQLPRVALFCVIFGCITLAIVQVASQIVLTDKAATFASTGSQTYEEAKDVFDSAILRGMAAAGLAAQLSLGFAFVMISLNAMRAGLLTKFMGILGIIVGVLFVVPLAPGPPVVQAFWLVALAALFGGRWPSGVPPAWRSGKAEPWPSAQEIREQRERELGKAEPAPAAAPAPAPASGHPSSKKRKRKKRR